MILALIVFLFIATFSNFSPRHDIDKGKTKQAFFLKLSLYLLEIRTLKGGISIKLASILYEVVDPIDQNCNSIN